MGQAYWAYRALENHSKASLPACLSVSAPSKPTHRTWLEAGVYANGVRPQIHSRPLHASVGSGEAWSQSWPLKHDVVPSRDSQSRNPPSKTSTTSLCSADFHLSSDVAKLWSLVEWIRPTEVRSNGIVSPLAHRYVVQSVAANSPKPCL